MEVWLRPNSRILVTGLAPSVLLGLLGGALLLIMDSHLLRTAGWTLVTSGVLLSLLILWHLLRPRIAYADERVLFYLQSGKPIEVPLEVVEAFFLGEGSANLPLSGDAEFRTVNLVARLSQKHPQWAQREVNAALGRWHDGYVSIRGTWCEPLTNELIRRLNRRLREVTAAARTAKSLQEQVVAEQ